MVCCYHLILNFITCDDTCLEEIGNWACELQHSSCILIDWEAEERSLGATEKVFTVYFIYLLSLKNCIYVSGKWCFHMCLHCVMTKRGKLVYLAVDTYKWCEHSKSSFRLVWYLLSSQNLISFHDSGGKLSKNWIKFPPKANMKLNHWLWFGSHPIVWD